jgi:hypothetical protein
VSESIFKKSFTEHIIEYANKNKFNFRGYGFNSDISNINASTIYKHFCGFYLVIDYVNTYYKIQNVYFNNLDFGFMFMIVVKNERNNVKITEIYRLAYDKYPKYKILNQYNEYVLIEILE